MTRAAARTIDPTRFTALLLLPTALASIRGRQGGFSLPVPRDGRSRQLGAGGRGVYMLCDLMRSHMLPFPPRTGGSETADDQSLVRRFLECR